MHHSNEQYHLHARRCKSARAGLHSQAAAAAPHGFGLSPRTGLICSPPAAPCPMATLSRRGSAGSGTPDQRSQEKRGSHGHGSRWALPTG